MIRFAEPKFALVAMLLLLPVVAHAGQPVALETQTNREGPVTVKVTPRNVSPAATTWDFEITLETHTVSLDQDMQRAAVLVDGSGKAQPPLSWDGDPPSGHHRKGVLRFSAPAGEVEFVELRVLDVGGVPRRVFRWRLR